MTPRKSIDSIPTSTSNCVLIYKKNETFILNNQSHGSTSISLTIKFLAELIDQFQNYIVLNVQLGCAKEIPVYI